MNAMRINVLWCDDDPSSDSNFIKRAFNKGLDIVVKNTVDEAIEELQNPLKSYDAIILDANCVMRPDGVQTPTYKALGRALNKLAEPQFKTLPRFIYSAGTGNGEMVIDLYADNDVYYNPFADKVWYQKPDDIELLFANIIKVVKNKEEYIVKAKYPEICSVFEERVFIDLLMAKEKDNFDSNRDVPKMIRDNITRLLDGLYKYKVIVYPTHVLGLNRCSRYLYNSPLVPSYIQNMFNTCISYSQQGSHTDTDLSQDIENHKAPYLNQACFYQLLTIFHWYVTEVITSDEKKLQERINQGMKMRDYNRMDRGILFYDKRIEQYVCLCGSQDSRVYLIEDDKLTKAFEPGELDEKSITIVQGTANPYYNSSLDYFYEGLSKNRVKNSIPFKVAPDKFFFTDLMDAEVFDRRVCTLK